MSALHDLAHLCGLYLDYWDVSGQRVESSTKSLLATLRALGLDIEREDQARDLLNHIRRERLVEGIEPVLTTFDGEAIPFTVSVVRDRHPHQFQAVILLESGETKTQTFHWNDGEDVPTNNSGFLAKRFRLGAGLPVGYHEASFDVGGNVLTSSILSAPRVAFLKGKDRKDWGVFIPLYALKTEHAWATGDYTDLENLGHWVGNHGGNLVGTLPILSAYLDDPCEPSPYSPVTRQFWNEAFLDVTRAAEFERTPEAKALLSDIDTVDKIVKMRQADMVAYKAQWDLKRQVLELLAKQVGSDAGRKQQFQAFLDAHPEVGAYATFRAARETLGHWWGDWPEPAKSGELSAEHYTDEVKHLFEYAQFLANEQIGAIEKNLGAKNVELYLDLPLGVRGDGYDVWSNQGCYSHTASAGAPPDALYTNGQNWGFPPLHPFGIRQDRYKHVRAFLKHHLSLCGRLRIDHVMGLHRLYWIAHELANHEGVYVAYRPEEFYAILCIESHREEAVLIGENLGTVPPEVNEQMDEHQIRLMSIVEYEVEAGEMSWMDRVPTNSIASLNTHDMPPFAGWWRGDDINVRKEIGLLNDEQVQSERLRREDLKQKLVAKLTELGHHTAHVPDAVSVTRALHTFLAASSTELVLLSVEDMWEETRPHNVPGTWKEHPNWQRKAQYPLEKWNQFTEVVETIADVKRERGGA